MINLLIKVVLIATVMLIQSCSSDLKKELNLVCEGKETTRGDRFGAETRNVVFSLKLERKLKNLRVNKFLYEEPLAKNSFNSTEVIWIASVDNGMPIFKEDSIGFVDGVVFSSQTIKTNSVEVDANQVVVISKFHHLYTNGENHKEGEGPSKADFYSFLNLYVNRQTGLYNMTTQEMYGKEYFLITSEGSCRLARDKF